MNTPPLQIEKISNVLLDYGVLGVILIAVAYFAWHLYKTQQTYADEWRKEAKEMTTAVVDISKEQNKINQRQVDIQEKQTIQTKEFYDALNIKMDEMPEKLIKEWRYLQMENKPNQWNASQ